MLGRQAAELLRVPAAGDAPIGEELDEAQFQLWDGLLNETLFASLSHARATLDDWRRGYNERRPHSSLGWATPAAYAETLSGAAGRGRCARAPRPGLLPPTTTTDQR